MARLVAVVLLLTLAVAPAVSAEPQSRGEPPFARWLDAVWDFVDRVFSWTPTIQSEPRKNGAFIDPSGVQGKAPNAEAYTEPSGIQSMLRKNGAFIDPSGVRVVRNPRGNPRLLEGVAIR